MSLVDTPLLPVPPAPPLPAIPLARAEGFEEVLLGGRAAAAWREGQRAPVHFLAGEAMTVFTLARMLVARELQPDLCFGFMCYAAWMDERLSGRRSASDLSELARVARGSTPLRPLGARLPSDLGGVVYQLVVEGVDVCPWHWAVTRTLPWAPPSEGGPASEEGARARSRALASWRALAGCKRVFVDASAWEATS